MAASSFTEVVVESTGGLTAEFANGPLVTPS
jgi:hypothetical protein